MFVRRLAHFDPSRSIVQHTPQSGRERLDRCFRYVPTGDAVHDCFRRSAECVHQYRPGHHHRLDRIDRQRDEPGHLWAL